MNFREGYLVDPSSPASSRTQARSLTDIDPATYSIRLAELLNSYWLISAGPYAVVYGFTGEPERSVTVSSEYAGTFISLKVDAIANTLSSYETLRCSNSWLVISMLSSLFVLLASITTVVLRIQRNTPELLLNWTTVVRHSHYIGTADVGSFVDDAERSRLLGDIKIRFGDVAPHKEVGHLAIGARDRSSRISEKSARDRGFE
ncbi:hypothetical protein Slin15195_G092870 [Septoria linicola]|uniref:Uncharacterized protein n=1 Tax=Septoria linicola TaxID=215465 RepID=A0A9Q9ENZ0_9PEZI|nr:hypothetical protein Slin15195_G092870 [Septoria linicola]